MSDNSFMLIFELSEGCPLTSNGACGLFQFDQAKALSKDHENHVIFLCLDIRSLRRERHLGFSHFQSDGIDILVESVPVGKSPYFIKRPVYSFLFKKIFRKACLLFGKPDIVHAHFGRTMGYVVWKNHRRMGFDYAITEHDSSLANGPLNQREKKILSKIYTEANIRIAVSPAFASKLGAEFGLSFHYVPNIVDSDSFIFDPAVHHPHAPFIFVSAGSLISRKRMDLLIRAFSRLNKVVPNVCLKIIGSGPEKNKLLNLGLQLKLQNNLFFLGQLSRNEISSVFSAADCFVLPSASETFGVVFIEAMYLGLPVIATRCGGPESFINSSCGYLIDVDDEDGLLNSMRQIIEKYLTFNSCAISEYSRNCFAPSVVSKQIMRLFYETQSKPKD